MGDTARKEPQIPFVDIFDKAATFLIDCRDPRGPRDHEGPFGTHMPVQFAQTALDQAHLHTGHLLGHRQIAHGDLAGPAAALDTFMRERKWILEGRLATRVGFRREVGGRVLTIQRGILGLRLLFVQQGVILRPNRNGLLCRSGRLHASNRYKCSG